MPKPDTVTITINTVTLEVDFHYLPGEPGTVGRLGSPSIPDAGREAGERGGVNERQGMPEVPQPQYQR